MADAAGLMRRLRARLGISEMPYALVPEFHADDHVHVHLLLDRYVDKGALAKAWGRGFVEIRKFQADVRGGAGGREAARRAAAYASKYVGKMFEAGAARRHRYEVAEGFQPAVVKRAGYRSLAAAIEFVENHAQTVVFAVNSEDLDDYDGLPFLWVCLEPG